MKVSWKILRAVLFWPVFLPALLLGEAAYWLGRGLFAFERLMVRVRDNANDRYDRMTLLPTHHLKARYGLDEKPPGWNDAVLGYFHNGPEARHITSEFADAFHRRAKKPPPRLWPPPRNGRRSRDVAPLERLACAFDMAAPRQS